MEHTPPFTLDERFFALSEIWLNERARTILQENHVTSARDFLRCMKNKTLRLSPSDAMMSALFSYAFSRMYQTLSKNRPPKEKELERLKINRMGMEPLPGDLPSEKEFWALANARLSIFARAALKTRGITSVRAFMSLTRQEVEAWRCYQSPLREFADLQEEIRASARPTAEEMEVYTP